MNHDELELVEADHEHVSEPQVTVGQVTWQGGHTGARNQAMAANNAVATEGSASASILEQKRLLRTKHRSTLDAFPSPPNTSKITISLSLPVLIFSVCLYLSLLSLFTFLSSPSTLFGV